MARTVADKDTGIPDMCYSEHSGIGEIWIQPEGRSCYGYYWKHAILKGQRRNIIIREKQEDILKRYCNCHFEQFTGRERKGGFKESQY